MGGVNKKKAGKNKGGKGGEKPKRSTPPHKEVRRALDACSPCQLEAVLHARLLPWFLAQSLFAFRLTGHHLIPVVIHRYLWVTQCHYLLVSTQLSVFATAYLLRVSKNLALTRVC